MLISPTPAERTMEFSAPAETGAGARHAVWAAGLLLLLAVALRAHGLFHDLPFSYTGDEINFVKRAMALGTGDLNPHWFHKPAFLMYLLLACYGAFFAVGSVLGDFASVDAFAAFYLANGGPFVMIGRTVVAAFGAGGVLMVYLIGRRIYGSATAAAAAALPAAVLFPMVAGAQIVKADVPCAFFIVLSVYAFLSTRGSAALRPLILAAAFAGVAMGTKYYGVILLPTFALAELIDRSAKGISWGALFKRWAVLGAVFVAAFFAVSPYNFLDPTFAADVLERLRSAAGIGAEPIFDPDNRVVYTPGVEHALGSFQLFLGKLTHPNALGWPLLILGALGLCRLAAGGQTRWHAVVLGLPVVMFMIAAYAMAAYHTNPRHLIAVYPLIAVMAVAGAGLLFGLVKTGPRWVAPGALALIAAASAPSLMTTVEAGMVARTTDSRSVAHAWILENLPRDARILQDDYGPILTPNHAALDRLAARLSLVPADDPVLKHHAKRIELLRRFPPPDAMNVEELGHQWWLSEELSDRELRTSPKQRDMANPLTLRVPMTLEGYRAEGYRYVVTNSDARGRYDDPMLARGFPSFTRFYRELSGLTPIKTFDPAALGGEGPVVWIYDLGPPAEPARR